MTIKGIGIDIVSNSRIQEILLKWGDRFRRKIYTPDEIDYCLGKPNPVPHFAGRYAAKEALMKALGHLEIVLLYRDIEITSDKGRPQARFSEKLQERVRQTSPFQIHLSLSHEKEFSIAYAIVL